MIKIFKHKSLQKFFNTGSVANIQPYHKQKLQIRLTNIMCNNVIYDYIAPTQDEIDHWFFLPPDSDEPIYVLEFPKSAAIYADSNDQNCVVIT